MVASSLSPLCGGSVRSLFVIQAIGKHRGQKLLIAQGDGIKTD